MKLEELARLAGVSRTTVSYVVNGKAKQYRVSERTIAKVEALIKGLGRNRDRHPRLH